MRAILILSVTVVLAGCGSDAAAEFGGESVGAGGSDGSGGGLEVPGAGGEGGASSSSSAESSASTGGGGASSNSSSSASSSSSGVVEPVSECDSAERGTPCTEGGGYFCDGAGACVEFLGIRCQLADGVHVCGDGVTRPRITADSAICFGAADEHVYAPPGEMCNVVGFDGYGETL